MRHRCVIALSTLALALAVAAPAARASPATQFVLTDGQLLVGELVELVPGVRVQVRLDDGRLAVERMTASQAGYAPQQARYDVERVLFTQYFDRGGNALHLNYWRPDAVFGATPTSHGCVGIQLHDAQYFWLFGEPGMRVEVHA